MALSNLSGWDRIRDYRRRNRILPSRRQSDFPESYTISSGIVKEKGYQITDACIGCGSCAEHCPQRCIEPGTPYQIQQEHCLHCGNCHTVCPVRVVEKRG